MNWKLGPCTLCDAYHDRQCGECGNPPCRGHECQWPTDAEEDARTGGSYRHTPPNSCGNDPDLQCEDCPDA